MNWLGKEGKEREFQTEGTAHLKTKKWEKKDKEMGGIDRREGERGIANISINVNN